MNLRVATASFAAFATMSAPHASAQSFAPSAAGSFAPSAADSFAPSAADSFAPSAADSFAPSAADSFAPSAADSFAPSAEESNAPSPAESGLDTSSPSAFGSIAPSFESVTFEQFASAECSANPACSALVGNCCPTNENIFLTCCFGAIGDSSAPSSEVGDSASPSSGVEDSASPSSESPTPSPADDEESSAPSDSPAISPVTEDSIAPSDANEEESSAPSATETSSLAPPQSTPPADLLLSITPIDFQGCIEDEDNVSNDKVFLRTCDSTKLAQKFKYDGALMRTGSNEGKCLQAGYNGDPAEGEFIRVVDCDLNNSLQKFSWDFESGFITLTDNPGFCMAFRGINDNVGADPILMKKCSLTDFEGTASFKWGIKS